MIARSRLLASLTAAVFVALVGRLWWLQVIGGDGFDQEVDGNRTRIVQRDAPRGRILDRHGRVLAETRTSTSVAIDVGRLSSLDPDARDAAFDALAAELTFAGTATTDDDLRSRFEAAVGKVIEPLVVARDVDVALWVALEERTIDGVVVTHRPVRTYPLGPVAAHVIGHVGTVTDPSEAERLGLAPDAATKPYRVGDVVGRSGLERAWEAQLRGVPEIVRVELDAANRVVGVVEVVQAPRPGADIVTTLDLDVQRTAERALVGSLLAARFGDGPAPGLPAPAGSAVALDPADGSVVAMASYPTFHPGWFVEGGDAERASAALDDDARPLLNRAIAGRYPPGSTFKPITAYAALDGGIRSADERWLDGGSYRIGNCRATAGNDCVVTNAGGVALGPVDLVDALARSSDTYFYSIGETLWLEPGDLGPTPIQEVARQLGLGEPTGVPLGGEDAGVVPVPGYADGERQWFTGDNVNLAIGQGDLLVTPIQLANAYAALASAGERYRPRLVDRVVDGETGEVLAIVEPVRVAEPSLDGAIVAPIADGLLGATAYGTAAGAFAGSALSLDGVAGKTGTAEVAGRADFALYAAVAPWEEAPGPRYAVAVVAEEAGFGSDAAAPVARRLLEVALGTSPTPTPTPARSAAIAAGPGDPARPAVGER